MIFAGSFAYDAFSSIGLIVVGATIVGAFIWWIKSNW